MAKKEYYNAQEAMKKLGLAKSTFYDYVKDGRIPQPQLPSFRQRGALFIAKEIDELANAMKGLIVSYENTEKEYDFRVAKVEDAEELSKLSNYIFEKVGGYGTPPEVFLEWTKLPYLEIVHILLHKNKIVGYCTTHPLHHEQIMQILNKEKRLRYIPVEEYALLEPDKPIEIFIGDIAATPDIKQLSINLIGKMLSYFQNLGKQGIEIKKIYAIGGTRAGINISRKAGMKQMNLPSLQPNFVPLELTVQEDKSILTDDYLKALKSYQRKQELTRRKETKTK
ncbi:MAG: hypothetical protein NVS2B12_14960 [Ktedonobacteraceae bacterium]